MKLNKLGIQNFKGIKSLDVDFKDETFIEGANRTGKSTIFDAFLWLLFGKNSDGKSDFGVKRFRADGSMTIKSEVLVIGFFDIDGKKLTIKRTLREKWQKKRGESVPVFTGNETIYEWNDTPIQQKGFQKRINEVINEDFFKLLTNPLYFNSLNWEKRRGMLINLIPAVSDNSKFGKLSSSDYADLKNSIKAQIKKLKDELNLIPVRIDEVHKGKPAPLKFANIQADLNSKQKSLESIEEKIINKNKVLIEFNDSRIADQLKLNSLKVELETYKSDFELNSNIGRTKLEQKMQKNKAEAEKCGDNIKNAESQIENYTTQLKFHETAKAKKLEEWHGINEQKFTEEACVSCGQKLPGTDIKEQKQSFLSNQEIELDKINEEGKKINFKIGELTQGITNQLLNLGTEKDNINDLEIRVSSLQNKLNKIKSPDIKTSAKYAQMMESYLDAKTKYDSVKPPSVDDLELQSQKQNLKNLIDELKKQLQVKTTIQTAENRIKELESQEKARATILLELENKEFEMEEFNRAKMTAMESEINKKFSFVKFKMFESQINGGEKEVCTTLIKGVPFSDANSEAKLNAGLDIINVFSEHYNISAPIFIDNREGVTDIIPVNAQIINLIVNPKFKTLKIS